MSTFWGCLRCEQKHGRANLARQRRRRPPLYRPGSAQLLPRCEAGWGAELARESAGTKQRRASALRSTPLPVPEVEKHMAYAMAEFADILPADAPVTVMLPAMENVRRKESRGRPHRDSVV